MTIERNPDHELQSLINEAYPSEVEGVDQPWGSGKTTDEGHEEWRGNEDDQRWYREEE